MSAAIIRTATDAAYEAAKELGKAAVLGDVPARRDECLDKAEDELRLALRLITEARSPTPATVHPIFGGILSAHLGRAA